MAELEYAALLNCKSAEEVRTRVREWGSSMSDDDHLVRSTILEIHARIEFEMKRILYQQMESLLCPQVDDGKTQRWRSELVRSVEKLGFLDVYRLLVPVFRSHAMPELRCIGALNDLRNQVAHGRLDDANYKGRNPFRDHDSLAQVYFEWWSALHDLDKIYDRRIAGPRLIAHEHEDGCQLHYDCAHGLR